LADVAGNIGRGEEKFGIVLHQLDAIRARINRLALQRAVFVATAGIIGSSAIIIGSAWLLAPLAFLITSAAAGAAGVSAIALAFYSAWRMRTDRAGAAAIADQRAHMGGRLTTIASFASAPSPSALWSYLVEDALMRREEFAPERIERRRLSRSVFAPLAAITLAILTIPLVREAPRRLASASQPDKTVTLDLRDLTIDPSAPAEQGGSEITGDAATMRKLNRMMARAHAGANRKDSFSRLMESANRLANRLQDKITGGPQKAPQRIKLADSGGDRSQATGPNDQSGQDSSTGEHNQDSQTGDPPQARHETGSPASPDGAANQQSGSPGALAKQGEADTPGSDTTPAAGPDVQQMPAVNRNSQNRGGAAHGASSDPNGLYGKADKPGTADGSFQIAIEAHPASIGDDSGDGRRAPKVEAALNPQQFADEPLSRTPVPAADRSAIERIFER
jgi:hypothetical protein